MRYFTFLFVLLLSVLSLPTIAQIIIVGQDMPVAYDTIRYSNANPVTTLDLTTTGPNVNWDFSNLTMVTQGIASFKRATQINGAYGLFFGFSAFGQLVIDSIGSGQYAVKNIYDFYQTSISSFNAVGRGLEISIVPVPIPSNYTIADQIYHLPLTYGRNDTTPYKVVFSLLTLGSFTQEGTRVNAVDGWGSLKTPYKTYPSVLRVKSQIAEKDSLGSSSLPSPITFNNNQVTYKWLAKNEHIPVLEVDGIEVAGVFVPTTIKYRDSLHTSALAPVADFTVNSQSGTTASIFNFTNQSTGAGNSYQWTFTPNTVTFPGLPSATSTNPNVQFTAQGDYTVELVATNLVGNSNKIKTSYVKVSAATGIEERRALLRVLSTRFTTHLVRRYNTATRLPTPPQ